MKELKTVESLTDQELLLRVVRLRAIEKRALSALLRHLAEMERRWEQLDLGVPSLFLYCTKKLGYSEGAAYKRVYACRVASQFPVLYEMLDRGETHLTAIMILGSKLTKDNWSSVLQNAAGKSKVEISFIAAALEPKPEKADHIRMIPAPKQETGASSSEPIFAPESPTGAAPQQSNPMPSPWERMASRHTIQPLSATRVRISFTGSKELLDLVHRAQDLLRHKYPAGDLERVFAEAIDALLENKDPDRRLARLDKTGRQAPDPSDCDPHSRRIPQGVRDAVWRRDGGQCVHVTPEGERCPERGGLEYDHVVPHALGGPSNNAKNIRLLCRAHNRIAAVRFFGDAATRRWTRPS